MTKVSREVHRKGVVRLDYDQLQAMKPAVAVLQRVGWDIRYKVNDITEVFEIYLEHKAFDQSDDYVEYKLEADGRVARVAGIHITETVELIEYQVLIKSTFFLINPFLPSF